jgi:hypothetical protein
VDAEYPVRVDVGKNFFWEMIFCFHGGLHYTFVAISFSMRDTVASRSLRSNQNFSTLARMYARKGIIRAGENSYALI